MRSFISLFWHMLLLLLLSTASAIANSKSEGFLRSDPSKPLSVLSDSLAVDDKSSVATFAGNVTASQGDFNLRSNTVRVFYTRKNAAPTPNAATPPLLGGEQTSISHVEAEGNVVITGQQANASANKATYNPNSGDLSMSGNVILTQNGRVIKGNQLTGNTIKGTVLITGGSQRVRAFLPPQQK